MMIFFTLYFFCPVLREILTANCGDRTELDRILGQLLNLILTRHRDKLGIYDHDISQFEKTYGISSNQFQKQFEAGTLGNEMDFFE